MRWFAALLIVLLSPTFAFAAAYPYGVGGTGTTTPNIGQLAWWSTSHLDGVATTTASCAGTNSCASFTVIGSSPVTITGSGGGSGVGTVATSALETAGQVAVFSTNSGYPARVYSVATSTNGTASTITAFDTNGNTTFNNYLGKATKVTSAGGTTVLTNASTRFQALTGSSAQTFQLPDATTLSLGPWFVFNNNSSQSLIITNNGGSTIYTVPAGGIVQCGPTDISTANGAWDCHGYFPSTVTWSSGSTGLVFNTALNTTPQIIAGASSAASPSFIPQRVSGTTGFGGDGSKLYGTISGTPILYIGASGASSTNLSIFGTSYFGGTATTTIDSAGNVTLPAASTFAGAGLASCSGASSAVTWNSSTKLFGCNTLTTGVSSVSNSDGTLTISPTTGVIVASLALAHANSWAGLQQFNAGASSTIFSSYGPAYFGGSATTTISSTGLLTIPASAGANIIPYASSTAISASSELFSATASSTSAFVSSLGSAAGTFVAADPSGKLIATTTPSAGTNYWSIGTGPLLGGIYNNGTGSSYVMVGTTTNSLPVNASNGSVRFQSIANTNENNIFRSSFIGDVIGVVGSSRDQVGGSNDDAVGILGYSSNSNNATGASTYGIVAENKGATSNNSSPNYALYAKQDSAYSTSFPNYAIYGNGLSFFTNSTSSLFSAYGPAYFGTTATSSFGTDGGLTLVTPAANSLLYTNGSNKVSAVTVSSPLSFTTGTLSCPTCSTGADPFTHPAANQSATTSLMLLYGNASTTQLTATSTVVFSGIGSGAVSASATGVLSAGTLSLANGGTNASLSGASDIIAMNSGNTALTTNSGYTLTSSLLTAPNASTTNLSAGSSNYMVNPLNEFPVYMASSTWGTGTTTPAIMIMNNVRALTWVDMQCSTDVGTVEGRIYTGTGAGTTILYFQASSTRGTLTFSSNNILTTSTTTYLVFGNAASSPTQVNCTPEYTYNQS